jgi:rubrerythrin
MNRRTLLSGLALSLVPILDVMQTAISFAASASVSETGNQTKYPNTALSMQQRYVDEMRAFHKYLAFSEQSIKDGYPNIAYLFAALASSESIHARNFKESLLELGAEPSLVDGLDFTVSTTRNNLKEATTVEANEINHEYPDIVKLISPENHQHSIDITTWAWQAEEQHRELIVTMQKNVVRWWGIVSAKIEEHPVTYYVCQVCGSTLTRIPKDKCPICSRPVSEYKQITPPEGYVFKPPKEEEEK